MTNTAPTASMWTVRVLVLLGICWMLAAGGTAHAVQLEGAGQIVATPEVLYVARDATATSTIAWATSAEVAAEVWMSVNGQPQQPFATGRAGRETATGIPEGRTMFVMRAQSDGRQLGSASVQAVRSGSLSASPSEIAVPEGGLGATTISWEMAEDADAQVWASVNGQPETLFAHARRGFETATFIPRGTTLFKLYKGAERELIDWATVTGKASSSVTPSAAPQPASCESSPVSAGARLTARVPGVRSQRGREARVRYGRRVRMRGRLTRSDGAPLPGAAVCVVAREAVPAGRVRSSDSVTTDARGRFSYTLSPGPSRVVEFVHRQGDRAASASVMVRVRAPVGLRASRRVLPSSQELTLSGRVRAQDVPRGTLIEVQAQRGRRWQTFGTTRTGREAKFRFRYRFTRTQGVQEYRLRARVPTQAALPFAPGASRSVVVRVRG